MEQAPIEKAPARLATTIDQGMAARFERHHGQGRTQFAQMSDRHAIQLTGPVLARMPDAGLAWKAGIHLSGNRSLIGPGLAGFPPLHENLDGFLAIAYQSVTNPAPEAPAICHDVQGFEQAGLAGAIAAGDQVQAGSGFDAGMLESAELPQLQTLDPHHRLLM